MVSLYTSFVSRIVHRSPYRLKCGEISRLVILLGLVGLAWLCACHLPRWLWGHLSLSPAFAKVLCWSLRINCQLDWVFINSYGRHVGHYIFDIYLSTQASPTTNRSTNLQYDNRISTCQRRHDRQ